MPDKPMVSRCVVWVKVTGPPEFLAAGVQIPIEAIQNERKRVVASPSVLSNSGALIAAAFALGSASFGVTTAYCQSPTKHKCRLGRNMLGSISDLRLLLSEIRQRDLQTIRRCLFQK
jgi:hypothetical protein